MEEMSICRVRENRYREYEEAAAKINEISLNLENVNEDGFFSGGHKIPDIATLRSDEVTHNLKKYLPYLIYYKDVYESDDEKLVDIKRYLDDLFLNWVEIVPDSYYEAIESKKTNDWKQAFLEERSDWLKDIIFAYGFEEFDEFVHDLEYLPFMRAYGVHKSKFDSYSLPDDLLDDLKVIWNHVQEM